MTTYEGAISQMHGRTTKKLDNNTYGRLNPDHPEVMIVRLHNTDILTITPEHVVITVDGYTTRTTKDRINNFLPAPFHVCTQNGKWLVRNYSTQEEFEFIEGCHITWDGKHDMPVWNPKATAKLKRSINTFCKDYMDAFFAGEIEKPGRGDCLMCQFIVTDSHKESEIGKPLGDKDKEHLLSHLEEQYYVPSLLYNAAFENEAHMSVMGKWVIGGWLHGEKFNDQMGSIMKDQLQRMLNKYLTQRLMA